MDIYRAIPKENVDKPVERNDGRRLPSHVSYLADNLWELTRPAHLPSRRNALYASRTPELALASGVDRTPLGLVACRMVFAHPPSIYQLPVKDAKEHEDIGVLQKAVNRKLRDWNNEGIVSKLALAPLFLPGISKKELQAAMRENALLREVVEDAITRVTFWSADQATVASTGELFFELVDGNTATLHPV